MGRNFIRMRKLALLLVALSIVARSQTPQQLVQDAMAKQQAGDLPGAVKEYREFLKLHPEATAIHSNLGAALAGLGRFAEAVSEYKFALKQSPKLPGARLNLALAYYKMGRIADGLKMDRKLVRLLPKNATAHYNLACSLALSKRPSEALHALENAVELGSQALNSFAALVVEEMRAQFHADAIQLFKSMAEQK